MVTGSRAPEPLDRSLTATRVVSRQELEERGAQTAASALALEPGVWIERGVGGAAASMHGLGSKYVLVLVDGQRQLGRVDGALDLDRFTTADLAQIELTSGPASALYGSDALGGVIHLVRRTPTESQVELATRIGSTEAVSATGSAAVVGERWFVTALGQWRQAPALDRDDSDESTTISGYHEQRAELRLGRRASEAGPRAELTATYLRRRLEGVTALATGAVTDRTNLVEEAGARASAELRLSSRARLTAAVGASLLRDQYVSDQRGGTALDQDQETRETLLEANALGERALGEHRIAAGLELARETLRSPRLDRAGARTRVALFALDRWQRDTLAVEPALRVDADRQLGVHVTPRLAARLELGADSLLRASAGAGYRAPSFKELSLFFENPGAGYLVEGNPDLEPETSRSLGLGVASRLTEGLRVQLDATWNELDSMIAIVALPTMDGAPQRFGYANVERARTLDAEVSAELERGRLGLTLGAAATHARALEPARDLPGVPPWRLRAAARWRDDDRGLTATAEAAFTASRPLGDEPQAERAPRRFDVRARIAKRVGAVVAAIGVDNLLDGGASELDPAPPRTVYLELVATRR